MKLVLPLLVVFASNAFAEAPAMQHRKLSSSSGKTAKVQPGHFFCGETDTSKGLEGMQEVLEGSCDPTKQYTVSVYSDSAAYANYGFCCIHK